MDITKLEQKNKCIFAIKLAEKASSYLQESNVKGLINEAIEVSWKWVHTEENVGEVLYNFLDNEENGFTLFQEMEEDEKKKCVGLYYRCCCICIKSRIRKRRHKIFTWAHWNCRWQYFHTYGAKFNFVWQHGMWIYWKDIQKMFGRS